MSGYNMNALKEYAVKMLESALECDMFDDYVSCLFPFSITIKDENGNDTECIFAKMEAIYNFYQNNPGSGIDQKLYDVLYELMHRYKTIGTLLPMLEIVEYQIVAEQENRAPFEMENAVLLGRLKENLRNNRELYQTDIYIRKNFMGVFSQHNEMLSRNYGYKIM